jgi:hypothetical protein
VLGPNPLPVLYRLTRLIYPRRFYGARR